MPLAGDATAPGLAFVGLRLTDGSLVLELERGGEAARSRLGPSSGFSPADGVLAQHDLVAEPRAFVSGLRAAAGAGGRGAPCRGGGRATVTC